MTTVCAFGNSNRQFSGFPNSVQDALGNVEFFLDNLIHKFLRVGANLAFVKNSFYLTASSIAFLVCTRLYVGNMIFC